MEENKKEEGNEKVKIYDKDMYISQEKLRTIAIIIIIFIIGFLTGYFSSNIMNNNTDLEIINTDNTSYSLNTENNK